MVIIITIKKTTDTLTNSIYQIKLHTELLVDKIEFRLLKFAKNSFSNGQIMVKGRVQ